MSFNCDEMKQLYETTKIMQKEHEKFIREFLLEISLRALAMVKRRTPVDTGELRRNWQISDVFRKGTNELYIVLFNPKEYASYIESGHRLKKGTRYRRSDGSWVTVKEDGWFEGYFMAKLSVEKIQSEMPVRYEKEFKAFCNGLGFDT